MTNVLVVDDSAVDRKLAGSLLERNYSATVTYAAHGADALNQMRQRQPDLVVTDLQMPEMNGLELVTAVRSQFPLVPVILMTAQGSEEIAVQALQKGAASYLPKSRLTNDLLETVENVLAVSRADRHHGRLMESLCQTEWSFVLENDTTLIPAMVDHVRQDLMRAKLGDATCITRLGIALHESLVNAIHHGNLELDSNMRDDDESKYHALAAERSKIDPYRQRRVYASVKVSRHEAVYNIRDEGPGFDPSQLPDPTDPANLERVSGRGLLLIRTFMDEVHHNRTGNQITMIKRAEPA
jgi:CheY-like chemotaxis protein/anti-sigma regulatory factor (Ser/Thr protein kinase)